MATDNQSKKSLTEKNRNQNDERLLTKLDLQEIGIQKQLKLLREKHQNELVRLASYQLKADEIKSLKEKICPVRNKSTKKINPRYEEYDFIQFHNFITEGKRDLKNELYELEKAKSLECFTEERKKGSKKKDKEQKWQEERTLRNLQMRSLGYAVNRQRILDDLETKDIIYNKNMQRINSKKLEIDAKKKKKLQEKEEKIKKAKEKEKLEQLEKINYYYSINFYQNKFNEKLKALQKNKKIQLERFEKERKDKILKLRLLLEKGDTDKKTKIQNLQKELPQIPEESPLRKQAIEEMKKKKKTDEDMIILLNIKEEELSKIREEQKKKEEEKKKKRRKRKKKKRNGKRKRRRKTKSTKYSIIRA